jgi:hypothetical protein
MPLRLSVVLVQGEHLAAIDRILASTGYDRAGVLETDVPGAFAHRTAAQILARANGPHEVLRLAEDQGWTALSDAGAGLAEDLLALSNLSRALGTKVVSLFAEPDRVGLSVHDDGTPLRRAAWGEDAMEQGEPLPVETLFGSDVPTIRDLMLVAQSVGVDVEALNERALYTLVEVEPAA